MKLQWILELVRTLQPPGSGSDHSDEMILGMDVMTKMRFLLDLKNGILRVEDEEISVR